MSINPTVMPKKRIKSLRELRGYALGERNPDTLPDPSNPKSESVQQDREASAKWDRLRRLVEGGKMIGTKY